MRSSSMDSWINAKAPAPYRLQEPKEQAHPSGMRRCLQQALQRVDGSIHRNGAVLGIAVCPAGAVPDGGGNGASVILVGFAFWVAQIDLVGMRTQGLAGIVGRPQRFVVDLRGNAVIEFAERMIILVLGAGDLAEFTQNISVLVEGGNGIQLPRVGPDAGIILYAVLQRTHIAVVAGVPVHQRHKENGCPGR